MTAVAQHPILPPGAKTGGKKRLLRRKIPFVLVNHPPIASNVPTVLIDNKSGTYALTRQLVELGHRRIACIHLPLEGRRVTEAAQERLFGYREGLAVHGIDPEPSLEREGVFGEEHGEAVGYRIASELLALPNPPTAIVCCNDYLAIGAMRACEAAGLVVPRDVAVVGHDNIAPSAYVRPALTTVHQPMAEAGEQAIQVLVQRIWGRHKEPYTPIRLPCTLVIRESSGHLFETKHA